MISVYKVQIGDEILIEFDRSKLEKAAKRRGVKRSQLWVSVLSTQANSLVKQRITFKNVKDQLTKQWTTKTVNRDIRNLHYEGQIAVGEAVYLGEYRKVKYMNHKWISEDYV